MREEHPIDERFKALHDAEVSPPDDVRDALAQHLGWGSGTKSGAGWRGWLFIAAGATLAITSAAYLGSRVDHAPLPVVQVHQTEQGAPVSETGGTTRVEGSAAPIPRLSAHVTSTDEAPSAAKTNAIDPITPRSTGRTEHSTRTASAPAATNDRNESGIDHRRLDGPALSTVSTNDPPVPASMEQHRHDTSLGSGDGPRASINESGTSTDDPFPRPTRRTWSVDVEDAVRMNGIPPGDRDVTSGPPLIAPRMTPYVLPAGQWWMGIYAGVGRMEGTWRGEGSEILNEAERWRGSTQWGLLVGRSWRSGWSISAGAGLGLIRSTFSYDEQPMELFVDVDTSWSSVNYNDTEHIVYTWNIDTVSSMRPGTMRSTRARNQYGALLVPITVAWHGDLRRWHYGAFGGVTAWIPTQREGSTLFHEAPDAAPRVVNVQDGRLNGRSGPRINTHMGLSLGFALTEHLSMFAEPMLTLPISTLGKAEAPWMKGRYLQFRLQHEFGAASR